MTAAAVSRIEHLVVVLVLLVVADGLVTQSVIALGLGREANPFLRSAVADPDFLLLKGAGALLAALLLWDICRVRPKLAMVTGTAAVAIYTAVLHWNLSVFLVAQARPPRPGRPQTLPGS